MESYYANRDVRNGRRLTHALFTTIVAKEAAVIACLAIGLLAPGTTLPAGTLASVASEPLRAALAFGLSLALMVLTYRGFGWARVGLGLNYLFLSGWAAFHGLQLTDALQTLSSKLVMGNAAVGLLIGLTLIFAPPLRAFAWYRAKTSRQRTIPVPMDDQLEHRPVHRKRTLGETLFVIISAVSNLAFIIVILALGALIYGFSDEILAWLRR